MNEVMILILAIIVIVLIGVCGMLVVNQRDMEKRISDVYKTSEFFKDELNTSIRDMEMKLRYIDNCIEIYTKERMDSQ